MENQQQNNKTAAIISYLTIIGWIIAFLIRDKNDSFTRVHLNQALIIAIVEVVASALTWIPIVGIVVWVVNVAAFVFAVWGFIRAIQGSSQPLPFIGGITLVQ